VFHLEKRTKGGKIILREKFPGGGMPPDPTGFAPLLENILCPLVAIPAREQY